MRALSLLICWHFGARAQLGCQSHSIQVHQRDVASEASAPRIQPTLPLLVSREVVVLRGPNSYFAGVSADDRSRGRPIRAPSRDRLWAALKSADGPMRKGWSHYATGGGQGFRVSTISPQAQSSKALRHEHQQAPQDAQRL